MKKLQFKTNVSCGGCIAKITPHLNQVNGIINWNVDTLNPMKILTIESENDNADDIIKAINEAGYKADLIALEKK